MDKQKEQLTEWLKDDLKPIMTEYLAKQIAELVINYGFTREVKRLNVDEVAKVIADHGNKNRSFLYDGCNIVATAICALKDKEKQ